ncbi:MAG: hypothetical protein HKP41_06480 [Desulfobacterales bacterium]|nr:Mth938-like domain-containing protein [Deltaproteobacteria bacterium]MBT8360396.1 Mth938-like domain-containing protein [Deltaproteobacteria bacterium]NNK93980.1 hypothetical protein [Desulfobacterales bacterium]
MDTKDSPIDQPKQSPKIQSLQWGSMEIEGIGSGKDFKLWPGGGRPWNWSESGTAHSPGIQVSDVEELVSSGCNVVVLTRGMLSRLKVPGKTLEYLKNNDIEAIVSDTKEGVKIYNEYAGRNIPVGGLFHSTC